MTDTGSPIIGALEAAWRDVQARHPQVPDVVIITGTARQAGGDRWGHHWPERWTLADGSGNAPELFAAGELLAQGGRRVLVLAASKVDRLCAEARRRNIRGRSSMNKAELKRKLGR